MILFAARSFADIGQSMRTSVFRMESVVHDGNGCHDAILNYVSTHTKKSLFVSSVCLFMAYTIQTIPSQSVILNNYFTSFMDCLKWRHVRAHTVS